MTNNSQAHQVALQVIQQAIAALLNGNISNSCQISDENNELIERAKKLLNLSNAKVGTLALLFDRIQLSEEVQKNKHFVPLLEYARQNQGEYPSIPYPSDKEPSKDELKKYQKDLAEELKPYLEPNWHNLNFLLFVLEKYGSCVSYGDSHTALVDVAKMTAAVAVALQQSQDNNPDMLYLVAGSLSGIQNFIYTISSDGALKSLRARSFYLELVAEEIVQQILEKLKLPHTNVIYSGGGNLYILAGENTSLKELDSLQDSINRWLQRTFQSKIFFALSNQPCSIKDNAIEFNEDFNHCWKSAIAEIAKQKQQKFIAQVKQGKLLAKHNSYQPCKVCHRDDVKEKHLKALNNSSSVLACPTCCRMFRLGGQLFKVKSILRKQSAEITGYIDHLEVLNTRYYLFDYVPQLLGSKTYEHLLLINNWNPLDYSSKNSRLLLLGNYSQQGEEGFIKAEEMAKAAEGIERVGYLRMDVDRLGQIFAKGLLDQEYSLPRVASLSRQMSYFFKIYLNSLANDRQTNFILQQDKGFKSLSESKRKNLMFIYAGGDDLFISGAWNEIVEFAFDIYQAFRAYTGNHRDITLSGGISIDDVKFPLYQSADSSGEAEDKAKANGRDSLGLFGVALKWEEWLGKESVLIKHIESIKEVAEYIGANENAEPLDLFGVLPIAQKIQSLLKSDAQVSRNFTRNLLATAQVQEQKIEELENKRVVKQYTDQDKDIRYFLHLPKIAYTLARLPNRVRENEKFASLSKSLKSPYNARYFRAIATWIELLNRGS